MSKNVGNLSEYHLSKIARSIDESERLLQSKKDELVYIFNRLKWVCVKNNRIKVAVLGCADPRHVEGHKRIFNNLFGNGVEVITFDITTSHLPNGEDIIEHDVVKPLPKRPFDLIYSHVLLKFVYPENPDLKFLVLKESFNALVKGGLAIHIINVGQRYAQNDPSVHDVSEYCRDNMIPFEIIPLPTRGNVVVLKK